MCVLNHYDFLESAILTDFFTFGVDSSSDDDDDDASLSLAAFDDFFFETADLVRFPIADFPRVFFTGVSFVLAEADDDRRVVRFFSCLFDDAHATNSLTYFSCSC
jgi:hypothetical protein